MLYLAENPIVRGAFFPPGAHTLTVERAEAADLDAIIRLREPYAGAEDARLLSDWWRVAPETFRVVRDPNEGFVGYFTIFSPDDVPAAAMRAQPVMQSWLRHLREDPIPKGQKVLFSHSTLMRDGEGVSPPLAAALLDIKRLYMEMRPNLRRIYVNVINAPILDQVLRQLYFERLPAHTSRSARSLSSRTSTTSGRRRSMAGWAASSAANWDLHRRSSTSLRGSSSSTGTARR